jgi:hypothetical protein
MDETCLYHYDLETKQQSMELRHSVSPSPKNVERKNSLRNIWAQDGILLIDYLPKAQIYRRVDLVVSAGAIEGHFEGNSPQEFHQGSHDLAEKCPAMPVNYNREEIGLPGLPFSLSPILFSVSGPFGLPPLS